MREIPRPSCLVLCGGQGTRLREAVPDQPKSLAEVNGRPFLIYLLEQLASFRCSDVVLCAGYMGEKIQAVIGGRYGRLNIRYSQEDKPLGTAGAIKAAIHYATSETILVLNGDSYIEYDLEKALQQHRDLRASFTMLLARVSNVQRFGIVRINDQQQVTGFSEKPSQNAEPCGLINAGAYLIDRRAIENFPSEAPLSMETNIIPSFLPNQLYGFVSEGRFIDIGTPEAYFSASEFFREFDIQERE